MKKINNKEVVKRSTHVISWLKSCETKEQARQLLNYWREYVSSKLKDGEDPYTDAMMVGGLMFASSEKLNLAGSVEKEK